MIKRFFLVFFIALGLVGCATTTNYKYTTNTKPYTVNGKTYYPMASANGFTESGTASWYGPGFHGKKTSSGEMYNQNAYTAAHKTLPFGTRLLVKNLDNGRSTNVVVNDRGPFKSGRIIDLSRAAASDLGMIGTGTARVRIKSVGTSGTVTPVTTNVAPKTVTSVTPSAGTYFVQVGAFSSLTNANNVATKLKNSGYAHRVVSGANGNYVVRAGPYSTKSAATSARDTLRDTYAGAFVVEQ